MSDITYKFTGDEKMPSIVYVGKNSTPVWIQQKWETGEYADFIQRNGCGHCCTAMALNLHGISMNPHEEFTMCREKWGEPEPEKLFREDNFMSASGIVKILSCFNVKAQCFGIEEGKSKKSAEHIDKSLKEGKQVIFWSHPSLKLADNPFSPGEHYVLAVGYAKNGKILVANSSSRALAENGIQFTTIETIEKSLYEGCSPEDFTWGRHNLERSGGYVVVG